jgi:hypothetical protein
MNSLRVIKNCVVSYPGTADQSFVINDTVAPWSVYYYPLLWSGNAVDSGVEAVGTNDPAFVPDVVVISPTDPNLGEEGLWFQPIGVDDMTIWYEDGKNL